MRKYQLPVPPGILVSGGAALAGIATGVILFFILALIGMI
jgi:hypothetical protein